MHIINKLCVYPKDIQLITGKSERQCRNIIKNMRTHYHKLPYQVITQKECYEYLGIPFE